ncbi:MAG: STT3 domain-containing protein, partial [Nanoarchaeota archaeon]
MDEEKKSEEKIIEERKKKALNIFKKNWVWVGLFLVIAVMLGVYIRSLPLTDHGGNPGLWDITTNSWTLAPDLDPWLFERYAKLIVENGSLPRIDMMRNVPLGFDTTTELQMVSYMIVITHKIAGVFGYNDIVFSAALMPVLFFALTIIVFFLFVREIFTRENSEDKNLKANLIAIISTFFMIVIPIFLSRTVAGVPEKESVAFFFMFLSFYLFLKAWKSEKIYFVIGLGILSGISTALMGLSWGGVQYIYVTMGVASFAAFILNKMNKKQSIVYLLWILFSLGVTFIFTNRYSLKNFLTSLDTGMASLVFFVIIVDFILWKIKASDRLTKIKLPKKIISLIATLVLAFILATLLLGPFFIFNKIDDINHIMFKPVTGRWSTTVAENRQPDFKEWGASFGPFIKNIPIFFWLFFIGSVLLFKNMTNVLKKKDSWILTGLYILFLCGMIFSRYSSSSVFNGENFISKLFYYSSALLFIGFFIYYYISYQKRGGKGFEEMEFEYLFLLALFVLTLFTARSAVRLIMVLGSVAPIFVSYLIIESFEKARKNKDETFKVIIWTLVILVIILSLITVFGIPGKIAGFYPQIKSEAYNFVPSYYNQQWQKAMQWVREDTPENSVFAHWWDYGYWVQSIGNRATVTDGGNKIVFWNYWTGRLVLTGDNQKDSLEFLYNHNATYLLIDSSDIGKYGAFASIGSDKNYDRYSWIGIFLLDEKQTQETNNQTLMVYPGGTASDEDLTIKENGKDIYLPGQRTGIGGIIIPVENKVNGTAFAQPY